MSATENHNASRVAAICEFEDRANNNCASRTALLRGASTISENITKNIFENKRPASTPKIEDHISQAAILRPTMAVQCSISSSSHTNTSPSNSISSSSALADTPLFSSNSLFHNTRKWEAVEIRYVDRDKSAPYQPEDVEEVVKAKVSPCPPTAATVAAEEDQFEIVAQGNQQEPEVKKQTVIVEKLHVRNLLNTIRQQCGDLSTSRLSEYRPARHDVVCSTRKRTSSQCKNLSVASSFEKESESVFPDSLRYYKNSKRSDLKYASSISIDVIACNDDKICIQNKSFREKKEDYHFHSYPKYKNSSMGSIDSASAHTDNPDAETSITESTSQNSHLGSKMRDQATQHDPDPCLCYAKSCSSHSTLSHELMDTIVICPKKQLVPREQNQSSGTRRLSRHAEHKTRDFSNKPIVKRRESFCSETQWSESMNSKQVSPVLSQEEINNYKQIALRILMDRKMLEQNRLKRQRRAALKANNTKSGVKSRGQEISITNKTLWPTKTTGRNAYSSVINNNVSKVNSRMKNKTSEEVNVGGQATEGSIISALRVKDQIEKHKRRMSQSPQGKSARARGQAHTMLQRVKPNTSTFSQKPRSCKVMSRNSQESFAAAGKSNIKTGKHTQKENDMSAAAGREQLKQISPISWSVLCALMNKEHKATNIVGRDFNKPTIRSERNALGTKKHKFDKDVIMYDEFYQIMLQATKNMERSKALFTTNGRQNNSAPNSNKVSKVAAGPKFCPRPASTSVCTWNKSSKTSTFEKIKAGQGTITNITHFIKPPKVISSFASKPSKRKCASSQTSLADHENPRAFPRSLSNISKRENKDRNPWTKDFKQQQNPLSAPQQKPYIERQHHLQKDKQLKSDTEGSPKLPSKLDRPNPVDFSPQKSTPEKSSGAAMNLEFAEMLRGILKSPTARATQALGSYQTNQAEAGDETNMTVDQIFRCYQELFSNTGIKVTNMESQLDNTPIQIIPEGEKGDKSPVRPFPPSDHVAVQRSPAKTSSCSQKLLYSPTLSSKHKCYRVEEKKQKIRSASVTLGRRKRLPGFRRQTQSSLNKINTSYSKPSSPTTFRVRSRNCSTERQNIRDRPKPTGIQSNLESDDKPTQGSSGSDYRYTSEGPKALAIVSISDTSPKVQPKTCANQYPKHLKQINGDSVCKKTEKIAPINKIRTNEHRQSDKKDIPEIVKATLTTCNLEQPSSSLEKDGSQYLQGTESNDKLNCLEQCNKKNNLFVEKNCSQFIQSSKDIKRKAFRSVSQPIVTTLNELEGSKILKNFRVLSETALQSQSSTKPPISVFSRCSEPTSSFKSGPRQNMQLKERKNESFLLVNSCHFDLKRSSNLRQKSLGDTEVTEKQENPTKPRIRLPEDRPQNAQIIDCGQRESTPAHSSFYAEISNEPQESPYSSFPKRDPLINTGGVKAGKSLSDSGLWLEHRQCDIWKFIFKETQDPHLCKLIRHEKKLRQQNSGVVHGPPSASNHMSSLPKHYRANFCPIQSRRVMEAKQLQPAVTETLRYRYLNLEDDNFDNVSTHRRCGAITRQASLSEATSFDEDCTSLTLAQKPPMSTGAKTLLPPLPKPRWRRMKKPSDALESDSTDESSLNRSAMNNITRTHEDHLPRNSSRAASAGNNSPSTCEESVIKQLQDRTVAKTCEMVLNQHQMLDTITSSETTENKLHSCLFGDFSEGSSNSSLKNDMSIAKASPSSSMHSSWVLSSSWEDERRNKEFRSKTSSSNGTTTSATTVGAEQDVLKTVCEKNAAESSVAKNDGEKLLRRRVMSDQKSHQKPSEKSRNSPIFTDEPSSAHDAPGSQTTFKGPTVCTLATPFAKDVLSDSNIFYETNRVRHSDDTKGKSLSLMSQRYNEEFMGKTREGMETSFACYNDMKDSEAGDSFEDSSTKFIIPGAIECSFGDELQREGHQTSGNDDNIPDLKARPLVSLEELRLSRVGRSIFAERRRINQARPNESKKGSIFGDYPTHVLDESQETCYVQAPGKLSFFSPYVDERSSPTEEPQFISTNLAPPYAFSTGNETFKFPKTFNYFSHTFNNLSLKLGGDSKSDRPSKKSWPTKTGNIIAMETHNLTNGPCNKPMSSSIPPNKAEDFPDNTYTIAGEVSNSVAADTQFAHLTRSGSEDLTQTSTPNEGDLDLQSPDTSLKNLVFCIDHCEKPEIDKASIISTITAVDFASRSPPPDQYSINSKAQDQLCLPSSQHKTQAQVLDSITQRTTSTLKWRTTVLPTAVAQTSTTDLSVVSTASPKGELTKKEVSTKRKTELQCQEIGKVPSVNVAINAHSAHPSVSPMRQPPRAKIDTSRYIEKKVWENLELFLESVKMEYDFGGNKTTREPSDPRPCSISAPPHSVNFGNSTQGVSPITGRYKMKEIKGSKRVIHSHEILEYPYVEQAGRQGNSGEIFRKSSPNNTCPQSTYLDYKSNYSSVRKSITPQMNGPVNFLISPISHSLLYGPETRTRIEPSNYLSPLSPPKCFQSLKRPIGSTAPDLLGTRGNATFEPISPLRENSPSHHSKTSYISPEPLHVPLMSPILSRQPITAGNPFNPNLFPLSSPERRPSHLYDEVNKPHTSWPPQTPILNWFSTDLEKVRSPNTGKPREFILTTSQPFLQGHDYPIDLLFRNPLSLQLTEEDIDYLIQMSGEKVCNEVDDISAILSLDIGEVSRCPTPTEGKNLMVFSDTEILSQKSLSDVISETSDLSIEIKNYIGVPHEPLNNQPAPCSSLSADSLMLLIQPSGFRHSNEFEKPPCHFADKTTFWSLKSKKKYTDVMESRSEGNTTSLGSSNGISYSIYTNTDNCLFCSKYCAASCTMVRSTPPKGNKVRKSGPCEGWNQGSQNPNSLINPRDFTGENLYQSLFHSLLKVVGEKEKLTATAIKSTNVWDTINLLTSKMFDLFTTHKLFSRKAAIRKKKRVILKRKGCLKIRKNVFQKTCKNRKLLLFKELEELLDDCHGKYQHCNRSKNIKKDLLDNKKSLYKRKKLSFKCSSTNTKELPVESRPLSKDADVKKSFLLDGSELVNLRKLEKCHHFNKQNNFHHYTMCKDSQIVQTASYRRPKDHKASINANLGPLTIGSSETRLKKQPYNALTDQDLRKNAYVQFEKEDPAKNCSTIRKVSFHNILTRDKENFQTIPFSKDSEANTSINANHFKEATTEETFNVSLSSSTDTFSVSIDSPPSKEIKGHAGRVTRKQSPLTSCFSSRLSEHSRIFSNSSFSLTESSGISTSPAVGKYSSLSRRSLHEVRLSTEKGKVAASEEKLKDRKHAHEEILISGNSCNVTNETKWVISAYETNFDFCELSLTPKSSVQTKFVMELFLPRAENSNALPGLPQVKPQATFDSSWFHQFKDIKWQDQVSEMFCFENESSNQAEIKFKRDQLKRDIPSESLVEKRKNESPNKKSWDKKYEDIPCVKTRGYRALEKLHDENEDMLFRLPGSDSENLGNPIYQSERDLDLLSLGILLLASADDILIGKSTKEAHVSYNIVEDIYDQTHPAMVPDSTTNQFKGEEKKGEGFIRLPYVSRLDSPLPYADFLYPNNVVMYDENIGLETGQFVHPNRNILFSSDRDLDRSYSRNKAKSSFIDNKGEFEKKVNGAEIPRINSTQKRCRSSPPQSNLSNLLCKRLKNSRINLYPSIFSHPNDFKKTYGKKNSEHYRNHFRRDRANPAKIYISRMQTASAPERPSDSLRKARKSNSCESNTSNTMFGRQPMNASFRREPIPTSNLLTDSAGGFWRLPTSPSSKPRHRETSLTSTDEFDVDTYRDLGSFITEMEDTNSSGTWDARYTRGELCHVRRVQDSSFTSTNSSSDLNSESKTGQYYRQTSSLSSTSILPMIKVNNYVDNCTQVYSTLPEDPAPLRCQGEQTNLIEETSDKSIQAHSNAPALSSYAFAYNILHDFMKLSLTTFVESLVDNKLKKEKHSSTCQDKKVGSSQHLDSQEDNTKRKNAANKSLSTNVLAHSPKAAENEIISNGPQVGEKDIQTVPMTKSLSKEKDVKKTLIKSSPPVDISKDTRQCCTDEGGEETPSSTENKEKNDAVTENRYPDTVATSGPLNPGDPETDLTYLVKNLKSLTLAPLCSKDFKFLPTDKAQKPDVNQANCSDLDVCEAYCTSNPTIFNSKRHTSVRDTALGRYTTQKTSYEPAAKESKPNILFVLANDPSINVQNLDPSEMPHNKNKQPSVLYFDPQDREHLKVRLESDNQTVLHKPNTPELVKGTSQQPISVTNVKTEEKTSQAKESLCEVTTISSSSSSLVDYGGLKYVLSRESKALWKHLTKLESSCENCEVCKRQYKSTTGRSLSPQYIRPIRTHQNRACRLHKHSKTDIRAERVHTSKSSTELEEESYHSNHSIREKKDIIDLCTPRTTDHKSEFNSTGVERETKETHIKVGTSKSPVFCLLNYADIDNLVSSKSAMDGNQSKRIDTYETTFNKPRLFLKRKQNLPITEDGIPPSKKPSQSSCRSSSHRDTLDYTHPRRKVTGGAYRRLGFLRGGKTAKMIQLFERSSSTSGRNSSYGLHSARLGSPPSGSSGWSNNASCGNVYTSCSLHLWNMHEETRIDSVPSSSTISKTKTNCTTPDPLVQYIKNNATSPKTSGSEVKYEPLSIAPSVLTNNHDNITLYLNANVVQSKAFSFLNELRNPREDLTSGLRDLRQISYGKKCHLSPISRPMAAAVAEFPLQLESPIEGEENNMDQRLELEEQQHVSPDQEEIIVEDYNSQRRQSSPDADQCIKTLGNILCEMRNTFPNITTHNYCYTSPKSSRTQDSSRKTARCRKQSLSPEILRVRKESNLTSLQFSDWNDMVQCRRKSHPRRSFSRPAATDLRVGSFSTSPGIEHKTLLMKPQLCHRDSKVNETMNSISNHSVSGISTSTSENARKIEGQTVGKDLTCNASYQNSRSLLYFGKALSMPNQNLQNSDKFCRPEETLQPFDSSGPPGTLQEQHHSLSSTSQRKSLTISCKAREDTKAMYQLSDFRKSGTLQKGENSCCPFGSNSITFEEKDAATDLICNIYAQNSKMISRTPPKVEILCTNNSTIRSFNNRTVLQRCEENFTQTQSNHPLARKGIAMNEKPQGVSKDLLRGRSSLIGDEQSDKGSSRKPNDTIPNSCDSNPGCNSTSEAQFVAEKPPLQGSLDKTSHVLNTKENLSGQHHASQESIKGKEHRWSRLNRGLVSMLRSSKHSPSLVVNHDNARQSSNATKGEESKRSNVRQKNPLLNNNIENKSLVFGPKETENCTRDEDGSLRPLPGSGSNIPSDQNKSKKKFDIKNILSFRKRNSSRDRKKH